DESKDGQTIEVAAGCLVTITLESNATTGFRWELAEPVDENMLTLIDSKYIPFEAEDGDEPVAGAGGTEEWTFETLAAGDSTISMAYSRPWEGGEKGVETFNVTIRSLSGRLPE
ncbi:MAG TPA: protease inhibitor I42 family protein, partial [Dehalococcoidia bacterium]|nr:protease inhibitor I42 family protein [Dehalococcoidia bacterium]